MKRTLALALLLALAAPAAARAQDPAPPEPPPAAALELTVERAHRAGDGWVALRGDDFVLRGTLAPMVAGRRVRLHVHRDGRLVRRIRIRPRADGSFTKRLEQGRTGRYAIRAHHAAAPALGAARSRKVTVRVLEPALAEGASGHLVRLLQKGLHRLRYAVPRNDHFDAATGRAVMAYRKVNGMARRYDADERVIRRVLAGRGAFQVRDPDAGRHVEADISRQVLALIDGDRVVATYHTSTGAPATPTVIGSFRVYRKDPGTNAIGMVHSSYFIRGYAIHGYHSVPHYNASHGCLRVPIPDAWRIYQWVRMGTRVIVYP